MYPLGGSIWIDVDPHVSTFDSLMEPLNVQGSNGSYKAINGSTSGSFEMDPMDPPRGSSTPDGSTPNKRFHSFHWFHLPFDPLDSMDTLDPLHSMDQMDLLSGSIGSTKFCKNI